MKLWIITKGHRSCTPVQYSSYFYSYTYRKTYLAVHFTSKYFFCQFVDRKVAGSMPKYSLLVGDTNQVSNFCPCVRQKWVKCVYLTSKLFSLNYLFQFLMTTVKYSRLIADLVDSLFDESVNIIGFLGNLENCYRAVIQWTPSNSLFSSTYFYTMVSFYKSLLSHFFNPSFHWRNLLFTSAICNFSDR